MTQMTDYRNSYIINSSAIDGKPCNTCRTQALARCTLIDDASGASDTFYLGKACIGEHMYLDGGIAQVPTAEVCITFGKERYKLQKHFADHRDDVVIIARPDEAAKLFDGRTAVWTELRFEIRRARATPLSTIEEMIVATESLKPLIAQTVIENPGLGTRCVLEYPIPYMNFRPDRRRIQIDVGPVLFAGPAGQVATGIEGIEMAYIMYTDLDRAEFAVRSATPVGSDGQTLHYSNIVHTKATTTLYSLDR
jgi:hypothetical protein